jgi:hypothetical protein
MVTIVSAPRGTDIRLVGSHAVRLARRRQDREELVGAKTRLRSHAESAGTEVGDKPSVVTSVAEGLNVWLVRKFWHLASPDR